MDDTIGELISNFQNYVVSPLNAFGLGGFVFDVEGESIANLSADITDHYTEDNKAVQDHIAIKPKKITLKGYVGELIFHGDDSATGFLETAVQKLTTLTAYLPTLASSADQLVNTFQQPSASDITLSDASNIFGLVKNLINAFGDQAQQAQGYSYFKALMEAKILMGVQTPWEFMTNMAIENVIAIQSEDTKTVTDFSVTLKEIRIAKTLTTAFGNSGAPDAANPSGSASSQYQDDSALQAAPPVNIGAVPGLTLPTSAVTGKFSQVNGVGSFFADPSVLNTFLSNPMAGF